MIKSFQPCFSANERTNQCLIQDKCHKCCYIKENKSNIPSNPTIFIDPNAQIYFLKSNNN